MTMTREEATAAGWGFGIRLRLQGLYNLEAGKFTGDANERMVQAIVGGVSAEGLDEELLKAVTAIERYPQAEPRLKMYAEIVHELARMHREGFRLTEVSVLAAIANEAVRLHATQDAFALAPPNKDPGASP